MDKISLEQVELGDIFSRCEDGYLYTKTGRSIDQGSGELPVCYCLDSEIEYAWRKDTRVYLLYKEEQTMEQVNKVYKPLVRTSDGRLLSIWAGGMAGVCLEYREGTITYTPPEGDGIWVCETLEAAKKQKNTQRLSGVFVVHEVTTLGEQCGEIMRNGFVSIFSGDTRYPAILLGKEVWREEPVSPEPKFKVGDKVVGTYASSPGEVLTVDHITGKEIWFTKGTWLTDDQVRLATEEEIRPEPKFKVGDRVVIVGEPSDIVSISWSLDEEANFYQPHEAGHYHYLLANTLTYDERVLSIAPKEEWTDITTECTIRLHPYRGYYIVIEYKNDWVVEIGLQRDTEFPKMRIGGGFKIVKAEELVDFDSFRVFKRNS